jgi:hypothetical protein
MMWLVLCIMLVGCKPSPAIEVWDDDRLVLAISDSLVAEIACCGKVIQVDLPEPTSGLLVGNFSYHHSVLVAPRFSRPDFPVTSVACFARCDRDIQPPVPGRFIIGFTVRGGRP